MIALVGILAYYKCSSENYVIPDMFSSINDEYQDPLENLNDLTFLQDFRQYSLDNNLNTEIESNYNNTQNTQSNRDIQGEFNTFSSCLNSNISAQNITSYSELITLNGFGCKDMSVENNVLTASQGSSYINYFQNFNTTHGGNFNNLKSNQNENKIENFLNQCQNFVPDNNLNKFVIDDINESCVKNESNIIKNTNFNKNRSGSPVHENKNYLQKQNDIENLARSSNGNECSLLQRLFMDKTENQPVESVKEIIKKIKTKFRTLNMLKTFEKRFMLLKASDDKVRSDLIGYLEELKKVTEFTLKICERCIINQEAIEDSAENRLILTKVFKLENKVKNVIEFFGRFIRKKYSFSPSKKYAYVQNNIDEIEKDAKNIKMIDFENIFKRDNSQKNSEKCGVNIPFTFESENKIHNFDFKFSKKVYPVSMAIFKEHIFLCIYNNKQYMKILKVNSETHEILKINEYTFEQEKRMKYQKFGFGSKHTLIRIGSDGKIFLLKSPVGDSYEESCAAKKSFEILVLDQKFTKLADISIDTIQVSIKNFQPAIHDFVVHNDLIYALDVKLKRLKIYGGLLEPIRTIPVPENFNSSCFTQLAVSSKFILINNLNTIYCARNNDNARKFDIIYCGENVYNITKYDEEYFMLKFVDRSNLIKIDENSLSIKFIPFPLLDRFQGEYLSTFTVIGNFIYSFSKTKNRVCRLNLNSSSIEHLVE